MFKYFAVIYSFGKFHKRNSSVSFIKKKNKEATIKMQASNIIHVNSTKLKFICSNRDLNSLFISLFCEKEDGFQHSIVLSLNATVYCAAAYNLSVVQKMAHSSHIFSYPFHLTDKFCWLHDSIIIQLFANIALTCAHRFKMSPK